MYRTVATEIWTDPKFRALPAPGKLLFIYLFTNPHAHVGGLYYLPDDLIIREAGVKREVLDTLFDTLSESGLCCRDKENDIIWVVNMLKWQGKGEKILRGVAAHLKTLHNCKLIPDFLQKYRSVKQYYKHRVSIPHPTQDEVGIQEQEQDITSTNVDVARAEAHTPEPDKADLPKKARKQPAGPMAELFRAFDEAWKARYGTGYKFAEGKDAGHLKWLLKAVGNDAQEAQRIIGSYLADADSFLEREKHPLSILISRFNKYHGRNGSAVLLDDSPLTVRA